MDKKWRRLCGVHDASGGLAERTMSRGHDFLRGVGASYAALGMTVLYSLSLVPIALRFLTAEEFGLWMVLVQISGYLSMIEIGVFTATSRILIDYKDQRDKGPYGGVIMTATAVFTVQGALMIMVGFFAAEPLARLFDVPEPLVSDAVFLLRWMALALGVATAFKIFSAILFANRRIDLVVFLQALGPLSGLGLVWLALSSGSGLRALPWAILPPVLLVAAAFFLACLVLGLFPKRNAWGRLRWERFKELFRLVPMLSCSISASNF